MQDNKSGCFFLNTVYIIAPVAVSTLAIVKSERIAECCDVANFATHLLGLSIFIGSL